MGLLQQERKEKSTRGYRSSNARYDLIYAN